MWQSGCWTRQAREALHAEGVTNSYLIHSRAMLMLAVNQIRPINANTNKALSRVWQGSCAEVGLDHEIPKKRNTLEKQRALRDVLRAGRVRNREQQRSRHEHVQVALVLWPSDLSSRVRREQPDGWHSKLYKCWSLRF